MLNIEEILVQRLSKRIKKRSNSLSEKMMRSKRENDV